MFALPPCLPSSTGMLRSQYGNTALMLGSANSHTEIVRALLQHEDIDVSIRNDALTRVYGVVRSLLPSHPSTSITHLCTRNTALHYRLLKLQKIWPAPVPLKSSFGYMVSHRDVLSCVHDLFSWLNFVILWPFIIHHFTRRAATRTSGARATRRNRHGRATRGE